MTSLYNYSLQCPSSLSIYSRDFLLLSAARIIRCQNPCVQYIRICTIQLIDATEYGKEIGVVYGCRVFRRRRTEVNNISQMSRHNNRSDHSVIKYNRRLVKPSQLSVNSNDWQILVKLYGWYIKNTIFDHISIYSCKIYTKTVYFSLQIEKYV